MSYKNHKPRYQPSEAAETANHHLVGFVWPIIGSKGDSYNVEMHEAGFTCNCMAFQLRAKCKHATEIDQRIGNNVTSDT